MENSDRQGEQGLPPQEQIGGSSSSSAPQNPKGESQDIFGTAPENFANTQLNPGEQYAPVGQTQGNPLANDSLLDQLPADSQALSQFLEGSQRAGAPPGGSSSSSADAGLSSGEDQGVGGGAGGDSGAAPGMSSSADDDLNVQPGSSGSMQESSDAPAADPPAASADDDLFGEGAADTGVTQLDSLQVQPEGVQEGENIEDLEEDLFGDGPAAVVPPASGGEGDAELEELFGDGDPAPPPQEAAALAVPVDPFAELDLDMEVDLREGMLPEEKASEGAADPFDDEEDLFGALSDADEDVMAEAVKIRKREKLKGGDKIALFNIPNILNWDALPFNADEELSVLEHMWHEKQDQSGNAIIQLKNPENSIRWRFQKDEHGGIVLDKHDMPKHESNTKIVEFENGDKFLVIGKEYFELTEKQNKIQREHIFSEQGPGTLVHHQAVMRTMGAVPLSIDSNTHSKLMSAQIRKVMPDRKIVPVTTQQVAEKMKLYALDQEQEKKTRKALGDKQSSQKKRTNVLDADFLEAEADDDGGANNGVSLKRLKKDGRSGGSSNMDAGFLGRTGRNLGGGGERGL
mmetsp:Transcript_499/g.1043  ORF Transcript_499/g.1043 Transcript_499/m.1043 type:complete len:574 (-) Transcript_499:438-2159(-)|eukprot:CAMPEP_0178991816 /NCGR_PEP_ID=MMETSP0795-20121207/5750_1 /TAXON_ID=88552 /ORGANISM="Amoebophrya sp., Strain Ameob2" /LENGTH=573 /DNA_ID=CAMNT_0020683591 /DNA_START=171 /DNA_END=1892 /DNA_ORIENTATION=+